MTRARRPRLATAVALVTVLMATGCSAETPSPPGPLDAAPASVSDVALVADVYRSRIDPARGGIQLSVRNDGSATVTIVRAVLDSPALTVPIERDRESEILPGQTRDLAMTLTTAACPAASSAPPDAVLTVVLADGTTAELTVPTTDRLGQWADWLAAECLAAGVAERATIAVRRDPARDDGAVIGARVEVELRGPGLELVALSDTVLFSLVDPASGERVTSTPLSNAGATSVATGGSGALSIPVLLTPARCDAHALADDKQGTLFRIDLLLDGEPGTVTIAADAATRAELYDAFGRACGF